jgi:peptidoglycan hydrolase-like protein with peptidoglycan-binding domain
MGVTALGFGLPAAGQGAPQSRPAAAKPALDRDVLHVQVILDHLGFSPGILDGREGQSLTAALRGYQISRQLPVTGKIDQRTLESLHEHRAVRPTRIVRLTPEMLAGPFIRPWPKEPQAQAKLKTMGYRSAIEKLAEMFHTTPQVLIELNSPETRLAVGVPVQFPGVNPAAGGYPADIKPEWRKTLADLNVGGAHRGRQVRQGAARVRQGRQARRAIQRHHREHQGSAADRQLEDQRRLPQSRLPL